MFRIALFGCGRIGQVHATSITNHDQTELAWVCDPVAEAAETTASRFGARATTSVEEVFADPSVHAIVIAAATPAHLDLLSRSVEAGKPVLCEKPIDLDLVRIDEAWPRLAPHEPRVMLGFNRRFDPTFAEIQQRVAAGEIGTLRQLRITSRDPEPPPQTYLAASGGIFRDMTIHDFDMARFFLGDIVEVQAMVPTAPESPFAEEGDVEQAMVLLRGADGALCQVTNHRSCTFGYDQRLEAFGDLGMLEAANQLPTSVRASGATATESAQPYLRFFVERYQDAYRAEFDAFVAAIAHDEAPSPSYADGRAALELAEAAERSAAKGTAVRLPLAAAS
jgi:myo-inositol 2-dehydrogenase/D-chiro-inositol 1-dehydrogenase